MIEVNLSIDDVCTTSFQDQKILNQILIQRIVKVFFWESRLYHSDIVYLSIKNIFLWFNYFCHLDLGISREIKDLREVLNFHVEVAFLGNKDRSYKPALHHFKLLIPFVLSEIIWLILFVNKWKVLNIWESNAPIIINFYLRSIWFVIFNWIDINLE